MSEIDVVLRANALNGEGPTWCARRKRLYWVDVRASALHAFDPATGRDQRWDLPAMIGCLGLTESGVIVALRTGLFRFDEATGALAFLAPPPFDPRRLLFNDGRCDPRGRFLVGTMYLALAEDQQPDAPKTAPLFRYDGRDVWTPLTPPVRTSNGLAFSPDGSRMYHADTRQKTVWVWDYDVETGAAVNQRVLARLDDLPEHTGPDGANVDRDGFYWCAVFGYGVLRRFDPDGKLEREVKLPVRYPTMPAFGGDGLATMYVTSANWPVPEAERIEKVDGAVLAMEAPVPGLPEPVFAG